jgi:hypothetical protein
MRKQSFKVRLLDGLLVHVICIFDALFIWGASRCLISADFAGVPPLTFGQCLLFILAVRYASKPIRMSRA